MTDQAVAADQLAFTPPSGGMWELETTHHGLRPVSPFLRESYVRAFEAGTAVLVRAYGLPLEGVSAALIHGCMYVRPKGIGEGSTPKPAPPKVVMKVVARLHPELRRRARAAARAFESRQWREEVDQWFERDRAALVKTNLDFQSVDLSHLDDAELAAQVSALLAHFEAQMRRNLATHGGDLMPVGDLLAHCEAWGISHSEAAGLLTGSSPATVETAQLLVPVAQAVRRSSTVPTSVEEVRALSPEARAATDEWLQRHAWRLVTSDDVDRPTLAEKPGLALKALLHAAQRDPAGDHEPTVSAVRSKVPEPARARFDELVDEARYGHRQREDIRGVCWNWSGGLLRRALLEVGRRLVERGMSRDPEHAAELFPGELAELLVRGRGPSAAELAERAAGRDAIERLPPPRMLGEPEEPPALDALPKAMARATAALMVNLVADVTAPGMGRLQGTGVGATTYRGRARVIDDVADALARIEPGDVLVARFTGPSFNSLVPILGAMVVEEGGALCHAAIVAREFGLPAVIGASGAVTDIPDGALVEVDPRAGTVRLC